MSRAFLCSLAVSVLFLSPAAAQDRPKEGDVVWAEWKPNAWFHGKIAKVAGKDFHIAFDDGDKSVVTSSKIAIDRAPKPTEVKPGVRVLAKFMKVNYYPGKISRIEDKTYHIQFDDGDTGTVTIEELRLICK